MRRATMGMVVVAAVCAAVFFIGGQVAAEGSGLSREELRDMWARDAARERASEDARQSQVVLLCLLGLVGTGLAVLWAVWLGMTARTQAKHLVSLGLVALLAVGGMMLYSPWHAGEVTKFPGSASRYYVVRDGVDYGFAFSRPWGVVGVAWGRLLAQIVPVLLLLGVRAAWMLDPRGARSGALVDGLWEHRQKVVLWAATGLIVVMMLFPPWVVENSRGKGAREGGYSFLFAPPSRSRGLSYKRLLLQMGVVVVVSGAALVGLRKRASAS